MIRQLKLDNIHSATAAERSFEEAHYVGFQVGAEGHHCDYAITIAGTTYTVGLGETLILPEGGAKGRATVEPLRKVVYQADDGIFLGDAINTWVSNAHVLAFDCPSELAIQPPSKLRRIDATFLAGSDGAGPEADALVLPFAGRSMARIVLGADLDAAAIYGGVYDKASLVGLEPGVAFEAPDRVVVLKANTALTASTGYRIPDEYFDVLVIKLGNGTSIGGANRSIDVEIY